MPKKLSKPHPESLSEVSRIKPTQNIIEFVDNLSKDIEEEKGNRAKWEQSIDLLDRLRFGIRSKKTKPWPNCANYSIPVIDNDIRKIKPSYVNLHYGVSPVATFVPFGPEDVEPMEKRELLHDWRLRTQVDFFKPYVIGIDHILGSRGQTVFRIIWKYKTRKYAEKIDTNDFPPEVQEALNDPRVTDEMLTQIIIEQFRIDTDFEENIEAVQKGVDKFRQGETEIDIDLLEVENNEPEITACDVSQDLVVPWDTKDINDARFVDYKFWMSKNDVLIAMNDGKYEKFDVDTIDKWVEGETTSEEESNDGLIQMHETCCWFDTNEDGIAERCITTFPDNDPDSVLRFIELPYDHGDWPYVQVKREILDDNFHSGRGLPSLKEDFQKGISTSVNQAVDYGTLMNLPERVARKGILSNPRNRRYVPGELTETNGPISEYEMRQSANISQPLLFQQAQYLKSWSDQTGQQTSGMSSGTDLPGLGERGKKTKAEVQALTAMSQEDKSLDLMIFQQQMAGVHYQIDALYYQYGDEEQEIQITGQPSQKVSREEIQGKFSIVPNGRLDNSTPSQRIQKSMFAFNIGFQNPYVKQDKLTQRVFKDLDPVMAQNLLYSEDELNKMQKIADQKQAQQAQESIQTQVGLRKVSDDLDVRKAALLEPIEGKKFAPD